jgi:hypothetical protein
MSKSSITCVQLLAAPYSLYSLTAGQFESVSVYTGILTHMFLATSSVTVYTRVRGTEGLMEDGSQAYIDLVPDLRTLDGPPKTLR